ncbi:Lrp/AsnC family transcriptional regulator, partial [Xylella fastidiosa subsp. multiplex]|nr:Lrp/AsnC family transcriptional regulator [Xylella fastidiosa subsp. multiplex]
MKVCYDTNNYLGGVLTMDKTDLKILNALQA